MATYAARIVERDGTVVRTISGANVEKVTRELLGYGQIVWSYPKYDPAGHTGQGADVVPLEREVQILRDGSIWAWGVILDPTGASSDGALRMTSPGVAWLFTRRNIDKPITNHLVNGNFETGDLTGWAALGSGITATVISSPRRRGGYAVRLEQPTVGEDSHLDQTITWTAGGIGDLVTIVGWYYIEDWDGPAVDARGLYVEAIDTGVVQTTSIATIDDASPQGSWQRLEITIWVPPNLTWDLNVRGYAVKSIVWDEFQAVAMESLSALPGGTDIATLFEEIVQFVQDPANDKDDLSIGTDVTATGVLLEDKAWQFANHVPADQAIAELVEFDAGLDWSIELADGTPCTKTATTFFPRKGTDRTGDLDLLYGPGGNIASYRLPGGAAAAVETNVTIMGDGDGPDREEGHATDLTHVDVVLQGVHSARRGTTIDLLDPIAEDRVAHTARLVRFLTVVVVGEDAITTLVEGDSVTVTIDDGNVQILGLFRILTIEHDCRAETLTLTLAEDD